MTADYTKRVAAIGQWLPEYIEKIRNARCLDHTWIYHVNASEDFLKDRCAKINQASTFIGEETDIENLVISMLHNKEEEIAEWLADKSDREDWEISGTLESNQVTGKLYVYDHKHRTVSGPHLCNRVIIYLSKNSDPSKIGFSVKTAYPTSTKLPVT